MAANFRNVLVDVEYLTGVTGAFDWVKFKLRKFGVTPTTIFPAADKRVKLVNNKATVSLWTNGDSDTPAEYECILPSGESFPFILEDGEGDVTLSELQQLGAPAGSQQGETIKAFLLANPEQFKGEPGEQGPEGPIVQGQVEIRKSDGTRVAMQAEADTDLARGALLIAAQTAAVAGDTIFVGPGVYNISTTVGKDLVALHFHAGAKVFSATGGSIVSFNQTIKITGHGEFTSPGGAMVSGGNGYIEADLIRATANAAAGLACTNGAVVRANVTKITSDLYDGVICGEGHMEINAHEIWGYDNAIETEAGFLSVRAHVIAVPFGSAIDLQGGTLRVNANTIIGTVMGNGSAGPFDAIVAAQEIRSPAAPDGHLVGIDGFASGGRLIIKGATIGPSGGFDPVQVGGSFLILDNCTIESASDYSISALSAQNVKVVSTLSANKPKHANITIVKPEHVY